MKKNDIILVTILLILAIVSYNVVKYAGNNNGSQVDVIINGEVSETFPLDENITYKIIIDNENYNLLSIKDGAASIIEASCPDKLCVKQKEITKTGESIICLPNKLVVSIVGKESTTVDAVAN